MLQLHLSDQQFYCPQRRILYSRFEGNSWYIMLCCEILIIIILHDGTLISENIMKIMNDQQNCKRNLSRSVVVSVLDDGFAPDDVTPSASKVMTKFMSNTGTKRIKLLWPNGKCWVVFNQVLISISISINITATKCRLPNSTVIIMTSWQWYLLSELLTNCEEIPYSDIKWPSCHLKLPVSGVFVQQFVQTDNKKTSQVHKTVPLCEGNPLVTGNFLHKGTVT